MTLLEDLEELNLLVPDAPSLTAGVHQKARELGQETAGLILDVAGWRAEAAGLADQLESALALLTEDVGLMRTTIESSVAIVLDAFAEALAALAEHRGALDAAADEAIEAIDAVAASASAAAELVSSACDEASLAASRQLEVFEAQQQALRNATAVGSYMPLLDGEAEATSTAARESASAIARQLRRLGPLAKGHLTDSMEAVQAHLGDLGEAVDTVMASYRSSADEMAEGVLGVTDEALIEVSMAADEADGAASSAAAAVAGEAERLAGEGVPFVTEQRALETRRAALVPYVEAAYRAQIQLDGGR